MLEKFGTHLLITNKQYIIIVTIIIVGASGIMIINRLFASWTVKNDVTISNHIKHSAYIKLRKWLLGTCILL